MVYSSSIIEQINDLIQDNDFALKNNDIDGFFSAIGYTGQAVPFIIELFATKFGIDVFSEAFGITEVPNLQGISEIKSIVLPSTISGIVSSDIIHGSGLAGLDLSNTKVTQIKDIFTDILPNVMFGLVLPDTVTSIDPTIFGQRDLYITMSSAQNLPVYSAYKDAVRAWGEHRGMSTDELREYLNTHMKRV